MSIMLILNSFRSIILYILLFFYWYSLDFSLTPLTVKQVMGICGIGVFLFNARIKFPIKLLKWFSVILFALLWSVIVSIFNETSEYLYLKHVLSFWMNFFAAYLIFIVGKHHFRDVNEFLKSILFVTLVQMVLSLIMYFDPAIKLLFFNIQNIAELDYRYFTVARVMGIGSAIYFGVLATSMIAMFFSIYLYFVDKKTKLHWKYLLYFVFISIVSFFIARTTIFLVLTSVMMFLFLSLKRGNWKFVFQISLGVVIVFLVYMYFFNVIDVSMKDWILSTFEFDSSDNKSSFGTLYGWITDTKFSLKTLLIGDGLYEGYYGGSDIGYFRHIRYGGIIDLLFVFILHIVMLRDIRTVLLNKVEALSVVFFVFITYCIILIKGDVDLLAESMLIYVCGYYIKNKDSNLVVKKC